MEDVSSSITLQVGADSVDSSAVWEVVAMVHTDEESYDGDVEDGGDEGGDEAKHLQRPGN